MQSEPMSIEQQLADWAHSLPRPDSGLAQSRAVAALTDGLACVLAGCRDEATQSALSAVLVAHGSGQCRVFGHSETLAPASAALVNGTAAHALDFDDNFLPALTHATAVLMPALMSLGQTFSVSGQRVIDAYIVGLELQARIGAQMNPRHYELGWHSTATIGAVGTAGAVAAMIGLNPARINAAMSLAFSMAAGSKLQFGTQAKPTHAGFAAHNAVLATLMARAGTTAKTEYLCAPWGFIDLYGGGDVSLQDRAGLMGDLGNRWAIIQDGLLMKRFPCCGSAHKALDGVEILMRDHGVTVENLASLTVCLHNPLYQNLRYDTPVSGAEARFSMSYPAIRLLQNGHLSLSDFTDDAVTDSQMQSQLPKIRRELVQADHINDPVELIAETKSGQRITVKAKELVGGPDEPLDDVALNKKIHDCLDWSGTMGFLPAFDELSQLVEVANVGELLLFRDQNLDSLHA